jgi:hypothetical protein
MPGAVPVDSARNDLAPFRDELSEDSRVFVIDRETLVRAEAADLSTKRHPPASKLFVVFRSFLFVSGAPICHVDPSTHFGFSLPFFLIQWRGLSLFES